MQKLRVLDLFSGIGGFSLGLERAGMETVAFCEYDQAAQKVLKLRWPNVPIFPDIREFKGDEITADVITGGYPCQPFSHAGKRRGTEDDRHLWPEMHRIIKAVMPRWVIAENVAGHVSMGLDAVLSDMEAANYTCWPFIIPACAVDAKHRRDRVWIIAQSGDKRCDNGGDNRQERHILSNIHRDAAKSESERHGRVSRVSKAGSYVADATSIRQSGPGQPIQWRGSQKGGERQADYAQSVGERCVWPTEPSVGRVAHGIPNRVDRLKQLGNSIVPDVVTIIGRAIMQAEAK